MATPQDTKLLGTAFAAWNQGGARGLEPFLADEIEWHEAPDAPDAAVHRGREETLALLRGWQPGSGQMHVSFEILDAFEESGEYVVVTQADVVGETSGTRLPTHEWFWVIRLHDGKFAQVRIFLSRAEALAAAGASI